MVHFTCDLCGRNLPASGEPRYVVKIEAYAGFDPNQITEDDLDEDHMEAIAELLQAEEGLSTELAPVRKAYRFDLCPGCHAKYTNDPLGRDLARLFDFSKN